MPKTARKPYGINAIDTSLILESQDRYLPNTHNHFPSYDEIESANDLRNAKRVAMRLQAVDWSFTKDDTGFLTHDLHPYPAKFIPQIPGTCIAQLSIPGELVLDPFGGCGTTALEAVRLGRRALSIDANPIGTLIGRVKTCNIDRMALRDLHGIRSALTSQLIDLPAANSLCGDYQQFIPDIPNIDKWFPITSRGELAAIRSRIARMNSDKAREIALLALSRIVLAVSFQDSETRYSSRPRDILPGETLERFISALDGIALSVVQTKAILRYGVCSFLTADSRRLIHELDKPESVDLIVTSPPYGNANDYHLYHRFRLLWIGDDPRDLAKIEIGSHLRHQKESSGFDSYLTEIEQSLAGMFQVLRPGRYTVLIAGDATYKNTLYRITEPLSDIGRRIGFEIVCTIERSIHRTKRSFSPAGRRATTENLLVFRKPPKERLVHFKLPHYSLWPFEEIIRKREIETIIDATLKNRMDGSEYLKLDPYTLTKARRLVYTHSIDLRSGDTQPTWQAILENGFEQQKSARKDPKYVTHGLHPYKGKFYPQLAKGLINLSCISAGSAVFDPFCGSGTTLLESYLNGHRSFGCDMNPLAAKIARAKIGILELDPDIVTEATSALITRIEDAPSVPIYQTDQFAPTCTKEISTWFSNPIIAKINWLLGSIRSVSEGVIKDFFEIILSSIIRDISQQDPTDLRIRRRKDILDDADVFKLYLTALDTQYTRIEKFWSIRGYSPFKFQSGHVVEGDARDRKTMNSLGLKNNSIDLLITSPPYATALPYIDTDRLSLLVLYGMNSSTRRPVEQNLIGSREILVNQRTQFEQMIFRDDNGVPPGITEYLRDLHNRVGKAKVGFRRKNMPSLLFRFFTDMSTVFKNCHNVLKTGSEAIIIIGDNRMLVGKNYERIPTTDFVQDIITACGFEFKERINISVTTDNMVHQKNAITENVVLRLMKSRKKIKR